MDAEDRHELLSWLQDRAERQDDSLDVDQLLDARKAGKAKTDGDG